MTHQSTQRLWVVGPLPPPINGQSLYTAAIVGRFSEAFVIRQHRIAGSVVDKLLSCLKAALDVLKNGRSGEVAYTTPPGQLGIVPFLLVILAMRWKGFNILIHHHTFRPVYKAPLRSMRLLVFLAGARQTHILLSRNMAALFRKFYGTGRDLRVIAVSNAWLSPPARPADVSPCARAITLGHMSVLTREKGVLQVLDIHRALLRRGIEAGLIIAGPVKDEELRQEIAAYCEHEPSATYLGPVSGDAKARFFASITDFVLPSSLVDEAEPLVMYETMSLGVNFYATPVGCIPEILPERYLLTADQESNAERIIRNRADQVDTHADSPTSLHEAAYSISVGQLSELIGSIIRLAASPGGGE